MERAQELGNHSLLAAPEDLGLSQDPERTVKDDPAREISQEQRTQVEQILDGEIWKNVGHTF